MPLVLVYNRPRLGSSLVDLEKHQDISFLFHGSYDTHLMISNDHSYGGISGNSPFKRKCMADISFFIMSQGEIYNQDVSCLILLEIFFASSIVDTFCTFF